MIDLPQTHWPTKVEQAKIIQQQLRDQVIHRNEVGRIELVAGVDVGFEDGGKITRAAIAVLADNLVSVGLGGDVVNADVERFLERHLRTYTLVFVDPPYADDDRSVADALSDLEPLVAPAGLVIVHRQARSAIVVPEFLTSVDERHYGDAVVTMMERIVS